MLSQRLQNWVGHSFGDQYRFEEKLTEGGVATVSKATSRICAALRPYLTIQLIDDCLKGIEALGLYTFK